MIRLGSTTEIEDVVSKGGKRIEINTTQAVRNSASKFLMKKCFNQAGVKTANWWYWKNNALVSGESDEAFSIENLPFPVILKGFYGSRGTSNYYAKDLAEFKALIANKQLSSYLVEQYHRYSKEYRLHITQEGCFYTCRKMLKRDTPENERYQKHLNNSVWILDSNPDFDKPKTWDAIVADCVKALDTIGLDIGCFDVLVQGNDKDTPEWRILESGSAASFGDITAQKYLEQIPIIATKKAKEAGLIN